MAGDIKVYHFIGSPIAGSFSSGYSSHAIQGEILKTVLTAKYAVGSVILQESGTGQVLYYQSAASGTLPIVAYPRTKLNDISGTLLNFASGLAAPNIVAAPLFLCGSGLVSGTSNSLSLDVYWR